MTIRFIAEEGGYYAVEDNDDYILWYYDDGYFNGAPHILSDSTFIPFHNWEAT